ncbi:hypothetical protein KKA15_03685 [Patescibacteria group bacterium]|nr:hypothetical protein [Patescibacteria group bacterium]
MPKVDIKEYAKYLLTEGTKDEKREILTCLKTELHLKNQKVYLKKGKKAKISESTRNWTPSQRLVRLWRRTNNFY